jgi:hypothetical protein
MKYRDYKRHVKLAEVLDKPLEGDFLVIDNYVKYLSSLKRKYRHYDYDHRVDIIFTDPYNKFVIIKCITYYAEVWEHNLPSYLFRNKNEVSGFLTEFINSELIDEKKCEIIHSTVFLKKTL